MSAYTQWNQSLQHIFQHHPHLSTDSKLFCVPHKVLTIRFNHRLPWRMRNLAISACHTHTHTHVVAVTVAGIWFICIDCLKSRHLCLIRPLLPALAPSITSSTFSLPACFWGVYKLLIIHSLANTFRHRHQHPSPTVIWLWHCLTPFGISQQICQKICTLRLNRI